MDTTTSARLRQRLKTAHDHLSATLKDVTPEQVHWVPPAVENPIGAIYGHTVFTEDEAVNVTIKAGTPLAMTKFAGKTGMSEAPSEKHAWLDWALRLRVDMNGLNVYADAVYADTDAWLATLSDADLARTIPTSRGERPVRWFFDNFILGHVVQHVFEISTEIDHYKAAHGSLK